MTTVQMMIRARPMLVFLNGGCQENIRYPSDFGLIEALGSYYSDTTFGMFIISSQGLHFHPDQSFVSGFCRAFHQKLLGSLCSWLIWWSSISEPYLYLPDFSSPYKPSPHSVVLASCPPQSQTLLVFVPQPASLVHTRSCKQFRADVSPSYAMGRCLINGI